jgi:hypothetical protein
MFTTVIDSNTLVILFVRFLTLIIIPMSHKFFIPCAVFGVALFTACGGSSPRIPDAPDAAIETISQELSAGNGGILWEAMPVSYQTDVNAIAQLAGTKVDVEVYDKSFSLIARLAEVANKQKAFILNTKLGGGQSAEEIAKIEAAWPSIIGFVQTIATSSISSTAGLQTFDGQLFCEQTISALVGYSKDLAVVTGEVDPLSLGAIKLVAATDTTAQLEMTAPDGGVSTESFTKVENRWVPTELASEWTTSVAEAKAQLEAISLEEIAQKKPQIMGAITMLEGVLAQLAAAENQEQFDLSLQGAMMPIMGLIMMQGGMGGAQ